MKFGWISCLSMYKTTFDEQLESCPEPELQVIWSASSETRQSLAKHSRPAKAGASEISLVNRLLTLQISNLSSHPLPTFISLTHPSSRGISISVIAQDSPIAAHCLPKWPTTPKSLRLAMTVSPC
jgi:hypothetical protein